MSEKVLGFRKKDATYYKDTKAYYVPCGLVPVVSLEKFEVDLFTAYIIGVEKGDTFRKFSEWRKDLLLAVRKRAKEGSEIVEEKTMESHKKQLPGLRLAEKEVSARISRYESGLDGTIHTSLIAELYDLKAKLRKQAGFK